MDFSYFRQLAAEKQSEEGQELLDRLWADFHLFMSLSRTAELKSRAAEITGVDETRKYFQKLLMSEPLVRGPVEAAHLSNFDPMSALQLTVAVLLDKVKQMQDILIENMNNNTIPTLVHTPK